MNTLSLRTSVAAAVAIACIAVVSALSVTLYTASEDLEETLMDQIVAEEMDYLVRHHLDNPQIVREPGPNLQYYVVQAPEDLARVPEALRATLMSFHDALRGVVVPGAPTALFAVAQAGLPPAASYPQTLVLVSDLNILAHSNGINWIRQDTGAVIV